MNGVVLVADFVSGFLIGFLVNFLAMLAVGAIVHEDFDESNGLLPSVVSSFVFILLIVSNSIAIYALHGYYTWTWYPGYALGLTGFFIRALTTYRVLSKQE